MHTKKKLAVFLSKLKVFDRPDFRLEQYPTDSEIASEVLWFASLKKDIEGKVIADLGCGSGILGIGTLVLGAKKVKFIDIDDKILKTLKTNLDEKYEYDNYEIIRKDIDGIKEKADVVIQNPPFGAKKENLNADRPFLKKAFEIAPVVYSFHMADTKRFIGKFSKEKGFRITDYFEFDFPIKKTHIFHKKKIHRIRVGCWRFEKE